MTAIELTNMNVRISEHTEYLEVTIEGSDGTELTAFAHPDSLYEQIVQSDTVSWGGTA